MSDILNDRLRAIRDRLVEERMKQDEENWLQGGTGNAWDKEESRKFHEAEVTALLYEIMNTT